MNNSNLELFRQALNEAVSNKFDKTAAKSTGVIVCSEKHEIAMRAIVYGKTDSKRTWSPRLKRIVAILVAAALILTSCGLVFRNEIREVFDEFFTSITFAKHQSNISTIEDIYIFSYLPEGFYLEKEDVSHLSVNYHFSNERGDELYFEQRVLSGSSFVINNEKGYSKIIEIEDISVYYRYTESYYSYIWNDGKYAFELSSNQKLTNEDINLIIKGIIKKIS